MDEWMNRVWSIPTMERYAATDRNEALIHMTTWTNLDDITLSQRSQTHRATYCILPLIRNGQNRQIYGNTEQSSGSLGLG